MLDFYFFFFDNLMLKHSKEHLLPNLKVSFCFMHLLHAFREQATYSFHAGEWMSFSKMFCCWATQLFQIFYCLAKNHSNFGSFASDTPNRSAFCLSWDLLCIHDKQQFSDSSVRILIYGLFWGGLFDQGTCTSFWRQKKRPKERSIIIPNNWTYLIKWECIMGFSF